MHVSSVKEFGFGTTLGILKLYFYVLCTADRFGCFRCVCVCVRS